MNPLLINIAGIEIDLSALSKDRINLFWKDPFFRSHLPTKDAGDLKRKVKKIRIGRWGNKTGPISFPFWLISKIIPKLLEGKRFLLHAAGLFYNESLIVLIGPSGAGKSTITGGLLAKGLKLVGDDKIVLSDKNKVICGNPIISLRRKDVARDICLKLGLEINYSNFTNKFYLEPKKVHVVSNRKPKRIFIIKIRLNSAKFKCLKLKPNNVSFDLFSDVLATARGFEGFSVDPPMILSKINCSDKILKNILKNINLITYNNKNNLFYMEGSCSRISQEIFKLIRK